MFKVTYSVENQLGRFRLMQSFISAEEAERVMRANQIAFRQSRCTDWKVERE